MNKSDIVRELRSHGESLIQDIDWVETQTRKTRNRSRIPITAEEAYSEGIAEIYHYNAIERFDIGRFPQRPDEEDSAYIRRLKTRMKGYIGLSIRHRALRLAKSLLKTRSQEVMMSDKLDVFEKNALHHEHTPAEERFDHLMSKLPDHPNADLIFEMYAQISNGVSYEEIERIYGKGLVTKMRRWATAQIGE